MSGPVGMLLEGGRRLHLQHGPIDLIIAADPKDLGCRRAVFEAAATRFDTILGEIVAELPELRQRVVSGTVEPSGHVATRMFSAVKPHAHGGFVTPMAAVAGAVADEVLAAMKTAAPLRRAYVNNGGDIAIHLAPGETYRSAMIGLDGHEQGRIEIRAEDRIAGIATSGTKGRSLSFGIADSVTVLADDAASADAAATLIANAVDLPGHPAIHRDAARNLFPDSDLGDLLVVTKVGILEAREAETALEAGVRAAQKMAKAGVIRAVSLTLQGVQRSLDPAENLQGKVPVHV